MSKILIGLLWLSSIAAMCGTIWLSEGNTASEKLFWIAVTLLGACVLTVLVTQ